MVNTLRAELSASLDRARVWTRYLAAGLSDAELRRQYDPELSPIGWHVGHIAWQKEVWALRQLGRREPMDAAVDCVYDTFQSIKSERGHRIQAAADLFRYYERAHAEVLELLARMELSSHAVHILRFLANHERQHAEIIGAVRLAGNLSLRVDPEGPPDRHPVVADANAPPWLDCPGGTFLLGSASEPEAWDNEQPAHAVQVAPFRIARALVSCEQWLEFMRAGGYSDARLWSAAGVEFLARTGVRAPRYWIEGTDGWEQQTLLGRQPLARERAVSHVSFHEVEAFARFAGARLPTEAEWELAASLDPRTGAKRRWPWGDAAPSASAPRHAPPPAGAACMPSAFGMWDAVGSVWQWTASPFAPYPGFRAQAYEGYSSPWFDGCHQVARGGSHLTAPEIGRCCFRNWYQPHIRQFALGCRLAACD